MHWRFRHQGREMIAWLKVRRLKLASAFSIGGDGLMGMGGAAGFFNWIVPKTGIADYALLLGGVIAVIGHAMVVLFGHGGARDDDEKGRGLAASHFGRAMMCWRYPLDFGLSCFVFSGLLYAAAGHFMHNPALIITGLLVFTASLLGWLNLVSMRMTAGIFFCATAMQFAAALLGHNLFMLLSAICYGICNIILATVRKENQSAYTKAV